MLGSLSFSDPHPFPVFWRAVQRITDCHPFFVYSQAVMVSFGLMSFITSLALKSALIYIGALVPYWLSAVYGFEEANRTRNDQSDELSIQLGKQATARRAALRVATLPVVIWLIWTCVQAANSPPD
jgi:hypothetical protein